MTRKNHASGDNGTSEEAADILAHFKGAPDKTRKRTLKEAVEDLPQPDHDILNDEIRRITGKR